MLKCVEVVNTIITMTTNDLLPTTCACGHDIMVTARYYITRSLGAQASIVKSL